jgi:hypothetical protein
MGSRQGPWTRNRRPWAQRGDKQAVLLANRKHDKMFRSLEYISWSDGFIVSFCIHKCSGKLHLYSSWDMPFQSLFAWIFLDMYVYSFYPFLVSSVKVCVDCPPSIHKFRLLVLLVGVLNLVWYQRRGLGFKSRILQFTKKLAVLNFMLQPVEPKVWTYREKVGNPHILLTNSC